MSARTHAQRPSPAANAAATPLAAPARPGPAARPGIPLGGSALDRKTSREMSARFGHDFSSVRIHSDAQAGQHAEAMGAQAYALGSDIVFGGGKYQPGSRETDRLLAHELTHVVQQARHGLGDGGRISGSADASEREAESLIDPVLAGQRVQVQAAPDALVARAGIPGVNLPYPFDGKLSPTWSGSTDSSHDNPQNMDRARQQQADQQGNSPTPNKWWQSQPADTSTPANPFAPTPTPCTGSQNPLLPPEMQLPLCGAGTPASTTTPAQTNSAPPATAPASTPSPAPTPVAPTPDPGPGDYNTPDGDSAAA